MASTNMGHNEHGPGGVEPEGPERGERRSRRRERRTERVGVILVIVGALALVSDLGVFRGLGDLVGMAIFAVLGGFALSHYLARRWIGSLIGAFVLFGLAAATVSGGSGGFYFLGLTGVGFAAVYYAERERWWAIIPAGTLLSLAVIAGLSSWAPGYDAGWVLFAGLALTFGLLYQLPGDPKPWAVYPAIASVVLAVLGLSFGGTWVLPVILVALGVYLLIRQRGEQEHPEAAGGRATRGEASGAWGAAGGVEASAAGQGEGGVEASAAEGAAGGGAQAGGGPPASGPVEGAGPSEASEGEEDEGRS